MTHADVNKVNLLGLSKAGLTEYFTALGEKSWRAAQVLQWIHHQGVKDPALMTNLSKPLREKLQQHTEICAPEVMFEGESPDGTRKWVLRLADGNAIETVFIPEKTRGTLCVSSQAGCTLNCDFCSTGKQGFNRNLTAAEIIGQVWIAARSLSKENGLHDHAITNVVMMGMGEPLLNFDNVVAAMDIMLDDHAYGLSKRRVTLSTAGVVPALYALRKVSDVALAVSLHAPNDTLRNELVPLNRKYPLKELMQACRDHFKDEPRRYVTMEYVMLAGVNDTATHARELIRLLTEGEGVRAKVNLIPFNPFPGTTYTRSTPEAIAAFQQILMNAGINTIVRKTRGEKIDAACGQLVGQVKDKTRRSAKHQQKLAAIKVIESK